MSTTPAQRPRRSGAQGRMSGQLQIQHAELVQRLGIAARQDGGHGSRATTAITTRTVRKSTGSSMQARSRSLATRQEQKRIVATPRPSQPCNIALRLQQLLRRAGARVILTRSTNDGWGPCITQRAAVGNRAHAAVAISVRRRRPERRTGLSRHPPPIKGRQFTDDIAASSSALALDIRAAFKKGTGIPYATYIGHNGLDVRSDLGGLIQSIPRCSSRLATCGAARDAALLTQAHFRQREARAIALGITTFLRGK